LVDDYDPRSLAVKEADAARARAFAERLLYQVEAPRRRVHLVLAQRFMGVAASALFALVIAYAVYALATPKDLAAGKPFRINQQWAGWASCLEHEDCKQVMFFTENTVDPWVEIDLGALKSVQ